VSKRVTATATMFGCDGEKILVWGPRATMKVAKKDAIRLAMVCLAQQKKFTIVNVKRYTKDLRELAALRKFTEPRSR
jgi:hypothetical protein